MNQSSRLFRLLVVLGVALAACGTPAPPAALQPGEPPAATLVEATLTGTASPAPTEPATVVLATPAATSRGPDLEASNPEAARLDAGSLQLVEFFRFT
jgi:hypothetical protein